MIKSRKISGEADLQQNFSPPRRHFLKTGALLAATMTLNLQGAVSERTIRLHNIHTGEHVDATFWASGQWIGSEMARIDHLLRDFRTGESTPMDPELLMLLSDLQRTFDTRRPFEIISGYRSPKTNAHLRASSPGVAKKSLHMQGRAVDVTLPGVRLASLRRAAIRLGRGGVGYYPASNFIHVDTGRVRHW